MVPQQVSDGAQSFLPHALSPALLSIDGLEIALCADDLSAVLSRVCTSGPPGLCRLQNAFNNYCFVLFKICMKNKYTKKWAVGDVEGLLQKHLLT